ncbi:HAMP domain-containing protein [Dongia sp.]|uniref:HAMP domain-containing protein n=1 Tax=Dongia sp. TaxID=1977262 RepID=UPI0037538819
MYQIIADAEINRALDQTARDWADKKAEADPDLAKVGATANTEAEKAAMAEAKTAHDQLVATFESEMLSGMAIVLGLAIAFLLTRAIVRPVKAMTATMGRLSRGDMSAEIPGIERKDEIGEMSQSVRVFKDSMVEAECLRQEQERRKVEAAAQRKADMAGLADQFEAAVGGMVKTVAKAFDRAARLRPIHVFNRGGNQQAGPGRGLRLQRGDHQRPDRGRRRGGIVAVGR